MLIMYSGSQLPSHHIDTDLVNNMGYLHGLITFVGTTPASKTLIAKTFTNWSVKDEFKADLVAMLKNGELRAKKVDSLRQNQKISATKATRSADKRRKRHSGGGGGSGASSRKKQRVREEPEEEPEEDEDEEMGGVALETPKR